MEGDIQRTKPRHDRSRRSARLGMGSSAAVGRASQGATGRFRHAGVQSTHATRIRPGQSRARAGQSSSYSAHGYTERILHGTPAFQSVPVQDEALQPFQPPFTRAQQQRNQRLLTQQQQEALSLLPLHPANVGHYGPEMTYDLDQHDDDPAPLASYDIVPQYQPRQSAAIEGMSVQFAVPHFFTPNEPTATGVPAVVAPYLTPHVHSSPYNHPGPIGRSSTVQPLYPATATMADFTPAGMTDRLDPGRHQQQQQQPPPQAPPSLHQPQQQQRQTQQSHSSHEPQSFQSAGYPDLDEAYRQFRRALYRTFDDIRAGQLTEASRSLLEISDWLVTNAQELGLLRDDKLPHSDRLQLWNDFNICWLAVCQRQKDLTHDLLGTGAGRRPSNNATLLNANAMQNLGDELIRLCDQLEQHGLVDYQMGIWEEEILSVLSQCLDLIQEHQHQPNPHQQPQMERPSPRPGERATSAPTPR